MTNELKMNDAQQAREFFEKKMQFTTGPIELQQQIENHTGLILVDVRAAEDFEKGHLPGAINLPRDKWKSREGLNKDKLNVLYCYSHVCHLAAAAAVEFASYGFSVMELDGGFKAWQDNDMEIECGGTDPRSDSPSALSA